MLHHDSTLRMPRSSKFPDHPITDVFALDNGQEQLPLAKLAKRYKS